MLKHQKYNFRKTFTNPSNGMIVDDVINVNDWVNKSDNKKINQDV